jgi:trimeric autotransporter adhesin
MKYSTFFSGMRFLVLLFLCDLSIECFGQTGNHFAGTNAGAGNTGSNNTASGSNALDAANSGSFNSALGRSALTTNTSGSDNTAVGGQAMFFNTTGWSNTALGRSALYKNTIGTENSAFGAYSLLNNTTGTNNIGFGIYSLKENSIGSNNIAIGTSALAQNSDGSNSIGIGYLALSSAINASTNMAIGSHAFKSLITGNDNVGVGHSVMNVMTVGSRNTTIGSTACLFATIANDNTSVGCQAAYFGTSAYSNCAIGFRALYQNVTGYRNVALGVEAANFSTGIGNLAVGYRAGFNMGTGGNNTNIGTETNVSLGTLTNANAYGYFALSNASNKSVIGNYAVGTVIGGYAAWSNLSDGRFKENIKNDVPGLDFINALQPVTYVVSMEKLDKHLTQMMPDSIARKYYKTEEEYALNKTIRHTGFIAQDVEKVAEKLGYEFDGLNKPTNPTDNYSLSYSTFVVPLVQAVKELDKKQQSKDQRISALELEWNQMKTVMTQMQESIQKINENQPANSPMVSYYTLSPNPAGGSIKLKIYSVLKSQIYSIRITDLNGKEIESMSVMCENAPLEIINESLAKGSYLVQVISANEDLGTQILIVE